MTRQNAGILLSCAGTALILVAVVFWPGVVIPAAMATLGGVLLGVGILIRWA